MSRVNIPEKKNSYGSAFQTAGTVVGAIYGGPAGASMGNSLGSAAGGLVANASGDNKQAQGVPGAEEPSAIDRRIQSLDSQPPEQHGDDLAKAQEALAYLPPDQQKQYGPAIQKARYLNSQETA